MLFKIHAENSDRVKRVFLYDNEKSTLTTEAGDLVCEVYPSQTHVNSVQATSKEDPVTKSAAVKTLKVSLGLSCNYECSYCSQRFVPNADSTNPDDVSKFVEMLTANLKSAPERIEFWGGEPFVYWKTFKPLAEALRVVYPEAHFSVITNGSLLDIEKNEWLDRLDFSVGFSHDGPGYHARGLDPLDNEEQRGAIMDLAKRLGPKGRFSVNAMMHKDNQSRAAVQTWLEDKFGAGVPIGEGTFVDPYDEGGLASMLPDRSEYIAYRRNAYQEIRNNQVWNFSVARLKIQEFVDSIQTQRQARTLVQKCGMDRADNLAVDLNGNIITCQNVSASAVAPNQEPHKIGHINDIGQAKLTTSTHWSNRKECLSCPVLQLCKGACMFLEGNLWDKACDGAYSDNIPFLAAGVEALTGFTPYYIDGPQREDRKDIFGFVNGVQPTKKFPVPVVAG